MRYSIKARLGSDAIVRGWYLSSDKKGKLGLYANPHEAVAELTRLHNASVERARLKAARKAAHETWEKEAKAKYLLLTGSVRGLD